MQRTFLAVITGLFLLAPAARPAEPAQAAADAQAVEHFEKNVRPVLVEHCHSCHGPTKQRGGLRLDSRANLLKGGDSGQAVNLTAPDQSLFLKAVRQEGDLKMPPKGKLDAKAVAALAEWVKMGSPWPEGEAHAAPARLTRAELRQKHWSFQPVKKPDVPTVKNAAWVRTPLDAFVLARLEAKGLTPTRPADRRTLIRRVTFDLTGLPPAPEEVEAFEDDRSPDAYEKLVDRLLASPRYGERWGRHWLDVARYADTKGYVFTDERRFPYAYTYRDYVIRAFNDDLPYDQFVTQQLAADLLPLGEDKRPLAAMGFLTLGRRFLNNAHDVIDDRMDVTVRGLQGLTVGCARCHDHKYDPIPQTDYYSLYGVFASSVEPKELPLVGQPEPTEAYANYERELKKREEVVAKFREAHKTELASGNRKFRDELKALQKKVDAWNVTAPAAPPRAMVLNDAPVPQKPHVFKRGNPNLPGDEVPRQYLLAVAGEGRKPFAQGSGRLELARAIANPDNPLTARVLVNRVWGWHFGQGIVRTPSDFGLRGEPPTHPELLDYLAATFVENGWSIKRLHRLILLSNTYRQASDDNPALTAIDPENRLLGKMSRQRLDFESLRDALLAVAGHLDSTAGGRPVELTTAPFTSRRSVYGFIDRQNLPGVFRTFDFASPDATTPQRFTTTVPQQALFLMNSPFVIEQARLFAAWPELTGLTEEQRIDRMIRLAYGRAADAEEIELGKRFLAAAKTGETGAGNRLTAWEKYAQVLLLANEFTFVD
jgi:mono/diheme cytochrome c family protein